MKKLRKTLLLTPEESDRLATAVPKGTSLSEFVVRLADEANREPPPRAEFDEWGLAAELLKDDGDHGWVGRTHSGLFSVDVVSRLVYEAESTGLRGDELASRVARGISPKELARARGPEYYATSAADVARMAANVAAAYSRQLIISAGQKAVEAAYSGEDPVAVVAATMARLGEVTAGARGTSIGDALRDMAVEVRRDAEEDAKGRRLSLGFPTLDSDVPRVRGGEIVVVAARPNVGKSLVAANIAHSLANRGVPVAVFSLEMKRSHVSARIASVHGTVASHSHDGSPNLADQDFIRACTEVSGMPIHVDDRPSLSAKDIWVATSCMVPKPRLVIVDYLGLMNHGDGENRAVAVGQSLKTLMAMGKTLDVAVVLLSQFNRQGADEPQLHHLRDSGEIEQDVSVAILMWSDDPNRRKIQCKIAKNRNYPNFGRFTLARVGASARLVEE